MSATFNNSGSKRNSPFSQVVTAEPRQQTFVVRESVVTSGASSPVRIQPPVAAPKKR